VNVSRIAVVLAVALVIAACKDAPPPVAEPTANECPTTGARACKDATDCGSSDLHCTGGRCFANQVGCSCSEVGDCGAAAHCTKGLCYANTVGVPCTQSTDCGTNGHCAGGGCYANTSGSPCSGDAECGGNSSCVRGTCN